MGRHVLSTTGFCPGARLLLIGIAIDVLTSVHSIDTIVVLFHSSYPLVFCVYTAGLHQAHQALRRSDGEVPGMRS